MKEHDHIQLSKPMEHKCTWISPLMDCGKINRGLLNMGTPLIEITSKPYMDTSGIHGSIYIGQRYSITVEAEMHIEDRHRNS